MLNQLLSRSCPICGTDRNSARVATANADATADRHDSAAHADASANDDANADARVFSESTVDTNRLDAFAFASRKVPEYMHHRLVHCRRCNLLYADPIPPSDELSAAYLDAAFDSGEEAAFAARTYGELLNHVSLPDKIGALDIGTGDGAFLKELLSRGFTNVAGVEPSAAPIQSADPAIRPLIHHGIFTGDEAPAASLSLVTCLQTIEHVPDPLTTCRAAMTLLKPGGALLIACHNRRGAVNRMLGKRSPVFDVEHLQLFDPISAARLLEASGFARISVTTYVNHYPLHYWLRLFPLPRRIKPAAIALSKKIGVGNIPLPMPAGNLSVVGYRPA